MFRVVFTLKICLCMLLLTAENLYAAPNVSLGYSINAQAHDAEDEVDEVLYGLNLGLSDSYSSSQFLASYDVSSEFFYEQKREDDNIQLNGTISSEYKFTRSFSWLFDSNLSEINTLNNNEFNQLDTQTLAITTTGLRYILDGQFKGELSFEALTNIYSYEESPLDARENLFRVSYRRPLSPISDLTTSYSVLEQMYDDASEVINDAENETLRIEYQTRLSRYTYDLFWENNKIEYVNQPLNDDIEGYGIGARYDINSRSSISANYENDVQQAFSINTALIDPQNPIITSGLVENKRYSIQYSHFRNIRSLSLTVYQNDIRNIASTLNSSERQKGVQLTYRQTITEKLSVDLAHTQLESEINTNDFDLTSASLNYLVNRSRYTNGVLSIIIEEGENNNIDDDDVIIQFNLTGVLFD